MQAIVTKYIGPTNVRGSRVKATAQAGSITLHWDDSRNADQNHKAAALALASELQWDYGQWVSGGLPDGTMVWVCHDGRTDESFTVNSKQ